MIKTGAWTLNTLAEYIGATLEGDPECSISKLNTLQNAEPGHLSFLANPSYQKHLESTQASAVILKPEQAAMFAGNKLLVANPYMGYAKLSPLFDPLPAAVVQVHPQAVVEPSVRLDETSVSIGANAYIGANVQLGKNVVIGPGCVIGESCIIGDGTRLHANVTLYHGVSVGVRTIIHSGCVIGADGFGFAPSQEGWVKIHQIGGVVIGDSVEVGACTTVDRGALDDTIIGNGVIIDNQVQIAHNVKIGDYTAIAGCTGIAGSTTIGQRCTIAGAVSIVGHISIADGVHISANSLVNKSILEPGGSYSSGTVLSPTKTWRKNAVRFGHLDQLANRLTSVEKQVKNNNDK